MSIFYLILDKRRLVIQGRSDGDGMEYNNYSENTSSNDMSSNMYNSIESPYSKHFTSLPGKRKEPKFVPYEPYKAAVSPIIPSTKKSENILTHLVIDSKKISSLASSVIQSNSRKELNEKSRIGGSKGNCYPENECFEKIEKLEARITQLEKEKDTLESQFKIQTEVSIFVIYMLL